MSFILQGVPRNMTIARRLESQSRLRYMNLFVTFSLLSTLKCMILETIITILLALAFPKSGLRFLCFQYYRRYEEFGSDFNFVK